VPGPATGQPSGFQPGREAPDDDFCSVHCAHHDPAAFTDAERLARAGFLAGYRGLTREAYALDLRQYTTWCRARSPALSAVRRAEIESFAGTGGQGPGPGYRHPAAVHHRRVGRYAAEEELLDHSPAAHVRRPRVDHQSHAVALDRDELGALLVAAGLGPPCEHALISLPALNGLRVSEAAGADIEQPGLERGHRTTTITRKGGKVVTIPLAPRTARAIDLAIGERTGGPVFLAADGRRLDRHGAGSRCVMCRRPPRTRTRERRCGMTAPAAAWTGTRPTSSPPASQAPHGTGVPAGSCSA
jgi:integrase